MTRSSIAMAKAAIILAECSRSKDIAEYISDLDQVTVIELNGYCHERVKVPATHLDNQYFIQKKMQGKRRVY